MKTVLKFSVALLLALALVSSGTPVNAMGDNPQPGSTDQPVLLVHGFADAHWTPWWDLQENYLEDVGYTDGQIYVMNLGDIPLTTVGGVEGYAEKVCSKLEDVSVNHGGKQVDVIAHSMGGLDTRWCAEKQKGQYYLDDLITVATPHQGTVVALLGTITPAGRDMVPGSSFLNELNTGALSDAVEYTAVWGTLDEAVTPNENAKLPEHMTWSTETRNIKAGPYGHLTLITLRDVFNQYVPYLD
ncbi:MAG: esterase/lipase family protein [bacterium]